MVRFIPDIKMNKDYFWALITIIIGIVLAILLLLSTREDSAEGEPLVSSKFDAELIALDRIAVADAYHGRVVHLFDIWMRDETGQPGRALVGVRQARRAYVEAMTEIEKREKQQ